ncbi:MAG: hypothetical protein AABW57_01870 [Nanoarchaeota archaeon]
MEIIKDDRKKQLFGLIINLCNLIEKENFKEYFRLKEGFNNLLRDIFGSRLKHGSEAWEWDNARNGLDTIFTLNSVFNGDEYEKRKKEQMIKALRRIEELKNYL